MQFFGSKQSVSASASTPTPAPASTDQAVELQLSGLHCTSCALNIDMTLEDLPGVKDVKTDYAQSRTTLQLTHEADMQEIESAIQELGYQVEKSSSLFYSCPPGSTSL